MQFRLRDFAVAELAGRTRLPFRFGAVTVTEAPLLHLQVRVEAVDGRSAVGMASDLLVPKWFRKDLDRDAAGDQAALRHRVAEATAAFADHGYASAFDHWWQVQRALVEALPPRAPSLLETGFGVALAERAMLDGCCRLAGLPIWSALRRDLFRRRPLPGHDHPLAPLPERPRTTIAVRHTVGRLDPLRANEVPAAERLTDGYPQALDEVLARHGVRWLKVKIGGGHDADVARLCAIGRLLDEQAPAVQVTLDGNEQFDDFAALQAVWDATAAVPQGRSLLQRVRWIEQPLPRAANDLGEPGPRRWTASPLVLDEGDVQLGTFATAPYDGVSVKNCKGVFRALANRDFAARTPGRFQTSEDLTNLPVLALQQDLCTAGCLDLGNSERNGHHYFPGLAHLPAPVVAAALAAHPDLYTATPAGAQLRIEAGELRTDSLYGPGFGVDQQVVEALAASLDWQPLG